MKKIINSVKGTRDFYPESMAVHNWLYNSLRQVSESFGYQEWEGPYLETLELYAAKSGDELVREQSFAFQDRGGDMITLRPELTPTLARMVAQRQNSLPAPLRWWSFGPFWRYERPQKGRTREFFQWNVDLVGVDTPEADAEIIAIIAYFFKKVGLTPDKVNILVNNRKLMDSELEDLSISPEMKPAISSWIDRREKLSPVDWEAYGYELGINKDQVAGVKAILSDRELWKKSEELYRVLDAVDALGVSEYVRYDAGVIRGLQYYTGTVFEAQESAGDIRRSILGGGRYDNLLAAVGGDPMPATGFAMGDVVISLILEKYGLLPASSSLPRPQVLITIFDRELTRTSLSLATELREYGLRVAHYPAPVKLARQFKYADRIGVNLVITIGPDEKTNNQVTVKQLDTGNQWMVARADVPRFITELLAPPAAS